MKEYIAEYMGTLVITTAFLLTHGDPVAMGVIHFAVFSMSQQYLNTFFIPFGSLAFYALGRILLKDALISTAVQLVGALSATVLFRPVVTLMQDM
jgi:hypothetical protein